jgi:transposase-like protein
MAESVPLEDIETGKISKSRRYFKAKVLEGHTAAEINEVIKNSIAESSIVFTDQSTSYVDIASLVEINISEQSTK